MVLIPLHMHISSAAPNSKMRHIWLDPMPEFIRSCSFRDCRGRKAIPDMDISSKGLAPERSRESRLGEHSCDPLSNRSVCSLCYPVLLRPIAHSVLSSNPGICSVLQECIGHVFTALVISQSIDLCTMVVLSIGLEGLESLEGVQFCSQGNNNSKLGVVIDEGDPILKS